MKARLTMTVMTPSNAITLPTWEASAIFIPRGPSTRIR